MQSKQKKINNWKIFAVLLLKYADSSIWKLRIWIESDMYIKIEFVMKSQIIPADVSIVYESKASFRVVRGAIVQAIVHIFW